MKNIQELLTQPQFAELQQAHRRVQELETMLKTILAENDLDENCCQIMHWTQAELCIGTSSAAIATRICQMLPQLQKTLAPMIGTAVVRCVKNV